MVKFILALIFFLGFGIVFAADFNLSSSRHVLPLKKIPNGPTEIVEIPEEEEKWVVIYYRSVWSEHKDQNNGEYGYMIPHVSFYHDKTAAPIAEIRQDRNFYMDDKLVCKFFYSTFPDPVFKGEGGYFHYAEPKYFTEEMKTKKKVNYKDGKGEVQYQYVDAFKDITKCPQLKPFFLYSGYEETEGDDGGYHLSEYAPFVILADDYDGEWGEIKPKDKKGKTVYFRFAEEERKYLRITMPRRLSLQTVKNEAPGLFAEVERWAVCFETGAKECEEKIIKWNPNFKNDNNERSHAMKLMGELLRWKLRSPYYDRSARKRILNFDYCDNKFFIRFVTYEEANTKDKDIKYSISDASARVCPKDEDCNEEGDDMRCPSRARR